MSTLGTGSILLDPGMDASGMSVSPLPDYAKKSDVLGVQDFLRERWQILQEQLSTLEAQVEEAASGRNFPNYNPAIVTLGQAVTQLGVSMQDTMTRMKSLEDKVDKFNSKLDLLLQVQNLTPTTNPLSAFPKEMVLSPGAGGSVGVPIKYSLIPSGSGGFNKITYIKFVREITGMGLGEAKAFVENLFPKGDKCEGPMTFVWTGSAPISPSSIPTGFSLTPRALTP